MLPLVGLIMTADTVANAGENPLVWDMATTTRRFQQSGSLQMIDEVFIYHDLMQLTNDSIAAAWAYNCWRESVGID